MSVVLNTPDSAVAGNPPRSAPVDDLPLWKSFPDAALSSLPAAAVKWSEVMPGGSHWSWRVRRGTAFRFVALDAGVNASLVLYAAHEKLERYNMPDSLKAQHTAHYSKGHVLMSDMGRSMASFVGDSLGWHDPLGALLDNELMARQYGEHRYQTYRNAMYRSGKDGLLIEIGKFGLTRRDLVAPVNLFSKVTVDAEGRFHFVPQHAKRGDFVDLRFDMDVIACVSTAPHPLDPATSYAPGKVGIAAWQCGVAPADDVCRTFRAENARALHNTDQLYL
jgi:urea carboxylase-associated protein 2